MARGKEPILSVLFQGRTIPIRNSSDLEIIQKFVSLVSEPKKAIGKREGRTRGMDRAKRKKKVGTMIGKGMKISEIAKKLGVTPMTVTRDAIEMKKE